MCEALDADPIAIIYAKMKKNEEKYPAEQCRGSSDKYTAYRKD